MEEQKNKRKAIILTIIAVLTLIGLVVGATFAYFQAQVGTGAKTDVTVKAGTTDDLSFLLTDLNATKEKVSDNDGTIPIVIEPNQTNFASGENSIADGVTGTATLIAGDDDYNAEGSYNVYLNITTNELQYTSYKKKVADETPENVLSFKDEATKAETDLNEYDPRPELYLTIKKGETEIKTGVTINDKALTYTSDVFTEGENQLGGFDITETKGLIKIRVPETISVNGSAENHTTTDTWEITVTFMNLDTDQYLNTGKSVIGEVLIQSEEKILTLAELCTDEKVSECFAENYKLDSFLIKHDGQPDYEGMENYELEAGDDSIRYTGGNSKISVSEEIINDLYESGNDCYENEYTMLYWLKTNENADKIKQMIELDNQICDGTKQENNLTPEEQEVFDEYYNTYSNDFFDSKEEAIQDAVDKGLINDYNVKTLDNYVCLDSKTTGTCESNDDLYRIIGLFKNNQDEYEMKLIKASVGTTTQLGDNETADGGAYSSETYYFWNISSGTNSENVNMWAESNLNKVNLNSFFYDYITTRATYLQNHITEHTWITGGYADSDVDAKAIYDAELGDGKVKVGDEVCYTQGNTYDTRECEESDLTYSGAEAHIGLFYISDYMYGASPASWSTSADSYNNVTSNNWLYTGMDEWSISRSLSSSHIVRLVDNMGYVNDDGFVDGIFTHVIFIAVRPSFYLTSDAKIKEGEGSKEKPYRISFE